MITASALDRLFHCPQSYWGPQVHTPSPQADAGTAIHASLVGDAAIDGGHAEVAYAYNPKTDAARTLGEGIGRDYCGISPDEVVGTADYVRADEDKVTIRDYKSGRGYTPPAPDNPQLAFLALAACRAHGREEARVELHYVDDDGCARAVEAAELDALSLSDFRWRLVDLMDAIKTCRDSPRPEYQSDGDSLRWCRYCPAYNVCPAKGAATVQALALAEAGKPSLATLVQSHPAQVFRAIAEAKSAIERAEELLKARALACPIDLGDGTLWGAQLKARESVVAEDAEAILSDLGLGDACPREVSCNKASIKTAAKRAAKETGQPAAHIEREALEALRNAGALVSKHYQTFGVWRAGQ